MTNLAEIILDLKNSKGLSDELIQIVIEDSLKAAYKKHFGIDDNAHIILDIDNNEVAIFSKKIIVDNVEDNITQIDFSEAQILEPECEIGDELHIEVKPEQFSRTEAKIASQKALQRIREFEDNSLFSDFKSKEGEIVIGYFLRENNNFITVDLGKTEGILPRKHQSAREIYKSGDRIKALIQEVKKSGNKLEVILSRTSTDFVRKIFELEVPELYDGTIEIVKIVREPGYRTKIAVRSLHSEVDPIGTCVGTKGIRINNVILELDGERIDILRYDPDPLTFIHNALSPADVKQVVIVDYSKKSAVVVVADEKLSVAIGKLGLNVRLANRLTDWSINIKTSSQFQEMEGYEELSNVFAVYNDTEEEEINITKVSELPNLDKSIIEKLISSKIEYIEDLIQMSNDELTSKDITSNEIRNIREVLQEFVDLENPDQYTAPSSDTSEDVEDVEPVEPDDEALTVEMLPLNSEVLAKIKDHNIESLYTFIQLYTEGKLYEIKGLTKDEQTHIETVIKENIELEEPDN